VGVDFGCVFFAVGCVFVMVPAALLAVVVAAGEVLPRRSPWLSTGDPDFPPPTARAMMKSRRTPPMTPSKMPFSFRLFRLPPPPGPEPGP
jgi:hypothetical protein